jgi:hypothetical protein
MATYTYDPTSVSRRNYARFLLGDTDVTAGVPLLADETIDNAFIEYGWPDGVSFLARGVISAISQEPSKLNEANGITVDFRDRIPAWRKLILDMAAGLYPDPITADGQSRSVPFTDITACNRAAW